MTTPEQALTQAREQVAALRETGAYGNADAAAVAGHSARRELPLYEWALIDPDLRDVRSTRRFGRPITAVKLALLRFLGQYHAALIAEQTRFNIAVAEQVRRLEERIEQLERRLDQERCTSIRCSRAPGPTTR